jgi:hypothetical protein
LADTVTKICMDIYRKLEKNWVLNIIEDLQIPGILEICYLYNLLWKYVKNIYINPGIDFLFVLNILKSFSKIEFILLYHLQSDTCTLHAFCNFPNRRGTLWWRVEIGTGRWSFWSYFFYYFDNFFLIWIYSDIMKLHVHVFELKQEAHGPHRSPESYWLIFCLWTHATLLFFIAIRSHCQ